MTEQMMAIMVSIRLVLRLLVCMYAPKYNDVDIKQNFLLYTYVFVIQNLMMIIISMTMRQL